MVWPVRDVLCLELFCCFQLVLFENHEMSKCFTQWVCPAAVESSPLEANRRVGLSRKLQSWSKMSPRVHVDPSQHPIILLPCVLHHLRRKMWWCLYIHSFVKRLRQIRSCWTSTAFALLQGVNVAQMIKCFLSVLWFDFWKTLTIGQKKAAAFGLRRQQRSSFIVVGQKVKL